MAGVTRRLRWTLMKFLGEVAERIAALPNPECSNQGVLTEAAERSGSPGRIGLPLSVAIRDLRAD